MKPYTTYGALEPLITNCKGRFVTMKVIKGSRRGREQLCMCRSIIVIVSCCERLTVVWFPSPLSPSLSLSPSPSESYIRAQLISLSMIKAIQFIKRHK